MRAIAFYRLAFADDHHPCTLPRQRKAAKEFARAKGFRVVGEWQGFSHDTESSLAELCHMASRRSAQACIVESADALAKDAELRQAAIIVLAGIGVRVLTTAGADLTAPLLPQAA